jgi:IS605 OrfB family transposase
MSNKPKDLEEEQETAEPEPLQFTYHTWLDISPGDAAILKDWARLAAQVEHSIWAGLQAKKPLTKNESLKTFGILGRQYNSYFYRAKADRSSTQARQKLDLIQLKDKIAKKEMIRDQAHGSGRTIELKNTLERLLFVKNEPIKPLTQKDLASIEKKILKTTKAMGKAPVLAKAKELETALEELKQKLASGNKPLNEKDIANLEKRILKTTKALKKAEDPQALYWKTEEINKLTRKLTKLEDDIENDYQKLTFGTNKLFRSQFHLLENGIKDHQEWKELWQHARSSNFSQLGSKDETSGNQVCQAEPNSDETITITATLPPALAEKYQQKTLVIPKIKWGYGRKEILLALDSCRRRKEAKSHIWSILDKDVKAILAKPISFFEDPWEIDERKMYAKAVQEPYQDLGQAIFYRFIEDNKGRWKIYAATGVSPGKAATSDEFGVIGSDLNEDHISLVNIDHHGNCLGRRQNKRINYHFYGLNANQREAEIERVAIEVVAWAKEKKKYLILEDLDFEKLKTKIGKTSPTRARYLHALPYSALREAILCRAYKEGVEVRFVNPAYGSVIGKFKFQTMYGLSSHASAALVNGRRYSRFSERPVPFKKYHLFLGLPTPLTFSLPDWNTKGTLWGWWNLVRRKLIRAVAPRSWARMRPLVPLRVLLGRNLQQRGKDSQDTTSEILVPSHSHRSDDPQESFGILGELGEPSSPSSLVGCCPSG